MVTFLPCKTKHSCIFCRILASDELWLIPICANLPFDFWTSAFSLPQYVTVLHSLLNIHFASSLFDIVVKWTCTKVRSEDRWIASSNVVEKRTTKDDCLSYFLNNVFGWHWLAPFLSIGSYCFVKLGELLLFEKKIHTNLCPHSCTRMMWRNECYPALGHTAVSQLHWYHLKLGSIHFSTFGDISSCEYGPAGRH